MNIKKITLAAFFSLGFLIILTNSVLAHQPRIVKRVNIEVIDPEISKAYYGQLYGQPNIYTITSKVPFVLYAGILVPDNKNSKKDVAAQISKGDRILAKIGGTNSVWKSFFEPFGQSSYWDGGEFKSQVDAGTYTITVSSEINDSKYSLAIGEREYFDEKESINALKVIPELKKDFFDESPISFIKSPLGAGYILVIYFISFIFGFILRWIVRKFSKGKIRGVHKNIGIRDRIIRLTIAVSLLLLAITTSWNPILLFISGFAFFEAIFSWCGFYAALGKNSCPIW